MAKLEFDKAGEHFYETGNEKVVVYPANESGAYPKGYAWNGVTGYTESPSGADETALYADNIKYLSLRAAETFGATITAYTYPDEFAKLDGSASPLDGVKIYQQARKAFGLCVKTLIGNDVDSNDHGYLLHLVYGLTCSPSERGYSTVNESPEAIEFSWELSSIPVAVPGTDANGKPFKNTSVITIDSRKFYNPTTKQYDAKFLALEDKLYGTDGTVSYALSADTTVDSTKTYYTRTGSDPNYIYTAVTPTGEENPTTEGWYEQSVTGGTDAYLPLPAEVISTLSTTVGG